MNRFLQILIEGNPDRKADFRLPSAEGSWGYPEDLLTHAGVGSGSGHSSEDAGQTAQTKESAPDQSSM